MNNTYLAGIVNVVAGLIMTASSIGLSYLLDCSVSNLCSTSLLVIKDFNFVAGLAVILAGVGFLVREYNHRRQSPEIEQGDTNAKMTRWIEQNPTLTPLISLDKRQLKELK